MDEPIDDDERYRQRPHDHLVEPMFGGLGVTGEDSDPAEAADSDGPVDPVATGRGCLGTGLLLVASAVAWI